MSRIEELRSWLGEHPAWSCALAALLVRACFVILPLERLDSLFFPDDAWYVLDIARGLASGAGPTPHGATPTNGFHPLLAFLQVPLFWLSSDPLVPARLTPAILGVVDAANAGLLVGMAIRYGGPRAGWLAGLAWAVSPLAIQHAMGGLETSLALLFALLTIKSGIAFRYLPNTRTSIFYGLTCGAALMARIDLAFVIIITSIWLFSKVPFNLHCLSGIFAVLLLSPWWIYEFSMFGTIVPESGAGTRTQVLIHRELYLKSEFWFAWAAGYLAAGAFFDAQSLRELLSANPTFGQYLLVLCLVLPASLGVMGLLRRRHEAIALLALAGVVTVVFYVAWVPAYWFFRRYFVLAEVVVILGAAIFAARGGRWRRMAFAAVSFAGSCQIGFWLISDGAPRDFGAHGAKGYLAPAAEVLALLPDGAVVGAFQTGALGYLSGSHPDRSIRVVNLDGVVNRPAQIAMKQRRLLDYARSQGITWIADWPINYRVLHQSSRKGTQRASMTVIGRARKQGIYAFVVSRVDWLDARTDGAPSF